MPHIEAIVNAAGGSFVEGETEAQLEQAFADAGMEAEFIFAAGGDELVAAAEAAASGNAEVLVGGGGDGTIGVIAAQAARHGKALGVLPLGTLNHFAKDLGIPQDLTAAARVIADGSRRAVDLAEVNGRIFINNSSIGLYPRMVHNRELQQERLGRGKWRAAIIAALRAFRIFPYFRVRFVLDGHEFVRFTPFVFVGNNEYAMDLYNIGSRERLDGGRLCIYILRRSGRWGILVLLFKTITGRLKQAKEFESLTVDEITIDVGKRRLMVALDGEVVIMDTPLRYRILPRGLTVISPRPTTERQVGNIQEVALDDTNTSTSNA